MNRKAKQRERKREKAKSVQLKWCPTGGLMVKGCGFDWEAGRTTRTALRVLK